MPSVGELTASVEPLTSGSMALDVLNLFLSRSEVLALPVVDQYNDYLGTVSRRTYLHFFSQAFARDLFARKSLAELLSAKPELGTTPLIARSDDRIDQVMLDLLNKDPNLVFEALPVHNEAGVTGVVTVANMMLTLSESQERLIDTMHELSARLKEEVAHAALLQRSLLPSPEIDLPGVRGVASLVPSTEVGGDYYDYYVAERRWVVLVVGDVSGHGVASGTMVSAAKAGLNLLATDGEKDPGRILSRLNETLLKTAQQRLLMTMFVVVLDTQTGELRYANAGHQFAYVYRPITGQLEALEIGGLPLGKDPGAQYAVAATELDVGDRLFLYTDGVVEEMDDQNEQFGYDRLESVLMQFGEHDAEVLRDRLMDELSKHVAGKSFGDDITILCVEHCERMRPQRMADDESPVRALGLVRIAEAFYRANPEPFSGRINRQNLVFLAEQQFAELIPRLSADGIRRVLPRHHATITRLGWERFLSQHQDPAGVDLLSLLPHPRLFRDYELGHSEDKAFIIAEIEAMLQETGLLDPDRLDAAVLLLDELIENGLYAAPRDGKGRPLHLKGTSRAMDAGEVLQVGVALQDDVLGLSFVDNWGTLTPAVFLNRLSRHVQGNGLISGVGGGGFYLMWRMADYLQLRVQPFTRTQVTTLMDLRTPLDPEMDKGFQFLFHSEVQEAVSHEQLHPYTADSSAAVG